MSHKYPMILARTVQDVERVLREAGAAGFAYYGLSVGEVASCLKTDIARKAGVGIYLARPNGMSWSGYPGCLINPAFTQVNSVAQAVSYFRRQELAKRVASQELAARRTAGRATLAPL